MKRRKNKQPPTHPWMVDGERVKRERMRRIAMAIAALRGSAKSGTPTPRMSRY